MNAATTKLVSVRNRIARLIAPVLYAPVLLKLDRRAVTAVEYALIASLIAISIIVGATAIGTKLSITFNKVATEL